MVETEHGLNEVTIETVERIQEGGLWRELNASIWT
jgi:hypothetical protein